MRGLSFVAITALQRNKGHASFCVIFVCCLISQGGQGEKRGVPFSLFLFFSSLPEQSLIITSSSSLTVCNRLLFVSVILCSLLRSSFKRFPHYGSKVLGVAAQSTECYVLEVRNREKNFNSTWSTNKGFIELIFLSACVHLVFNSFFTNI